MRDYNNLIRSICEECGIKLTLLTDTWVKVLEKDTFEKLELLYLNEN